jgi:hypothetical protein
MRLDPIERMNLGLSAGAAVAAFALAARPAAAGFALGAAFGALNLHVLHSAARRMFEGQLGGGLWTMLFALRFVLLAAAIGLSLAAGAEPVAFVAGLSLMVPATVIGAWRMRPAAVETPAAPALAPDDPSWDRWSVWLAREREPVEEDDDA